MSHIQQINEATSTITGVLVELTEIAETKAGEIEALDAQIIEKKSENESLIAAHNAKKDALEKETADTELKLKNVNALLDDANDDLAEAQSKLTAAQTAHSQFVAYESRANAALKAYEQSLLQKGESLDNIIGTAKRRASILADIK